MVEYWYWKMFYIYTLDLLTIKLNELKLIFGKQMDNERFKLLEFILGQYLVPIELIITQG
jgi:hypothetical protein